MVYVRLVFVQSVGLAGFIACVEGLRQVHPALALVAGGAAAVTWAILKSRNA